MIDKNKTDTTELDENAQKKLTKEALTFFARYTASIEINRNNVLYKQYFPKLPPCFYMDKDVKKQFMNGINRTTLNSKVNSMLLLSEEVIESLKINTNIKNFAGSNFLLSLITRHLKLWKDLSFFLCILQNVVILRWSTDILEDQHDFQLSIRITDVNSANIQKKTLLLMEILQIVFSGIVWIFSISKRMPLVIKKAQKHIMISEGQENKNKDEDDTEFADKVERFNYKRLLTRSLIYLKFTVLDYFIMYYMIYTALAFLALFNPLFIAILLCDIFLRFPLLLYVLASILKPRMQIFLTMILFIIIQYYFALAAYYIFPEDFQDYCEDLYSCFSIIIDRTFKSDSGIGSFFPKFKEQYVLAELSWRWIYDFLNAFIILNLIIEIIAGIIIDTFAVLREEMERKNDDIENYCFICGINRHILDKKTEERKGFVYHISYEHNLWNYIFYILYLKHKEKTEYSGIESYVASNLDNNDISWLPLNKALSLGDTTYGFEKEDELEESTAENEDQTMISKEVIGKLENLEKELDTFQNNLEKNLKNYNLRQTKDN